MINLRAIQNPGRSAVKQIVNMEDTLAKGLKRETPGNISKMFQSGSLTGKGKCGLIFLCSNFCFK